MAENPLAKILIVDDEAAQMKALCHTLKDHGYETTGFISAQEAVRAMGETKFDLLLTDLMMPEMNGISLLQAAFQMDPNLIGIIMTGEGTITTAVEAMKSGALDYILKPFKLKAILPALDRALAVRRLRMENARLERHVRERTEQLTLANQSLHQAIEDLQQSQAALKTAHLQLIQAEKMETVGRMAAGVAHEVRNPLQILLMNLDYLSQRMAGAHDSVLDGVITDMRDAAKRADTIICGLLDFSHSDALELQPQDLNALIEKALVLVRHNLASNHIKLQTDLGAGLPPLALDGVKIEQIFVNLFANAIDAMPKGGALTVKTSRATLTETQRDPGAREAGHFYAGDTVVLVDVEDTGSGIAPEVLRKIFDPFFTTKATGKGTGLGLTIVKRILDLHGGTIEIRNRAAGGAHCRLMFKATKRNQS